jgi:hypothetical protein
VERRKEISKASLRLFIHESLSLECVWMSIRVEIGGGGGVLMKHEESRRKRKEGLERRKKKLRPPKLWVFIHKSLSFECVWMGSGIQVRICV